MKRFLNYILLVLSALALYNCGTSEPEYIDPRGANFAGAISCKECHATIYNNALKTSHYQSSAAASVQNVLGHFAPPHNTYVYDNETKIVMENRKNKLFQVYYKDGKEIKAYPFDVVMGAKNAQTSLFWDRDVVYELPLSHYKSVNNWGTSPSYPPHQPYFTRGISVDCFECHSSYIEPKKTNPDADVFFGTGEIQEHFKKESLVLGIDCERCHGPAKEHVQYHHNNPDDKLAKHIVTHQSLSSQEKLAGCVICHVATEKLQSRFKYLPGDKVKDFYNEEKIKEVVDGDVHGNQYGLLAQSKCFLESKNLDCTTCHSTHSAAKESLFAQSQKCLSCHTVAKKNFCTTKMPTTIALQNNCIDCHMPKQASKAIGFFLSGKAEMSPYFLRTHKIGIYPEAKNTSIK